MNRKLKDIGEFGIIDRIAAKTKVDRSVIKGIGDDAAVIRFSKDRYLLFTTDMLVEDVHFRLKQATAFQIGWKALACNISDIAAMGGIPRYSLVSIGLSSNLSIRFVDQLYRGIQQIAKRFHINMVGGDISSSRRLIVCISLLGEVRPQELVLRSGAKVGDRIFVTGKLGGSRYPQKSARHLAFIPRLKEAQFLVKNYRLNSMIDISDGLSRDLNQITKSSDMGAAIFEDSIPLSAQAKDLKQAISDGEDFELLFTLSAQEARRLPSSIPGRIKTPLTQIGKIVDKRFGTRIVDKAGRSKLLRPKGFTHF